MILQRCLGAYLYRSGRVWNHLPASLRLRSPGLAYGRHLHALVRMHAQRGQNHATFFLRNRAELALMCRLLDRKAPNSEVDISVVACSKGAEVYSILWALRSSCPDLKVNLHAIDISQEILDFAERGIYSRSNPDVLKALNQEGSGTGNLIWNTNRDQVNVSMFERMTGQEVEAMFEVEGDEARIRSRLKDGISWLRGDAGDPELVDRLGPQDIVVANRFLCHMEPTAAERCLRNVAQLVRPGGYLFVSGIDLDVRTKVARDLSWKPVTELMREIHEGDGSLRRGWPLEYWGLEPFCDDRPDWKIRYASVFEVGKAD